MLDGFRNFGQIFSRNRRTGWLLLLGLAAPACVTSPLSNTSADVGASGILFTGLANYQAGLTVTIQAREANGSFTNLASVPVTTDGRWSLSVSVPDHYFPAICGSATFRARTNHGDVLPVLDSTCVSALPAHATSAQIAACNVSNIVVARASGVTYNGNLTLNGQAAADPYRCVSVVTGDLTIVAGRVGLLPGYYQAGVTFTLPNLTHVTGNLAVDGDRAESVSLPLLTQVGGDLSLSMAQFATLIPPVTQLTPEFPTTALNLPALASVTGSVVLHNEHEHVPSGGTVHYNFDLAALTTVGANIHVENTVFPGAVDGLNSLTSVPGNVVIEWGVTDLDNSTLLSGVTHVHGDLELGAPPNARTLMDGLTTVDGSVTVRRADSTLASDPRIGPALWSGLTHIGGNLALQHTSDADICTAIFPALTQLSGALQITDGTTSPIGATGAAHLALGSLQISAATDSNIPLHADAQVASAGAISVSNSPDLCPCQVDAFVAGQQSSGWAGTETNTGNGATASCKPCPAALCP